ncbi:hypothetical protein [uncultured Zhongshania sp.]|uniref:hypothetical protein n=1 Tax=uncultured Zhongshania sp. TaxID=1642288 RepID=UPI0030DBD380|tara:strand:+ start:199 stop:378 length:180 start_codon:yes stop_codon:yes gene_type:complete
MDDAPEMLVRLGGDVIRRPIASVHILGPNIPPVKKPLLKENEVLLEVIGEPIPRIIKAC